MNEEKGNYQMENHWNTAESIEAAVDERNEELRLQR
jgi:hypothetical protein